MRAYSTYAKIIRAALPTIINVGAFVGPVGMRGITEESATRNPPGKDAALGIGIDIATAIAACGPVGIKATLRAAHMAVDESTDGAAYTELQTAYVHVFGSPDFIEGRKAELESRRPVFHGDV